MNYNETYLSLIEQHQVHDVGMYGEWHHIVPRCMGGTDSTENLVRISARAHYIAHLLLVKMYPGNNKLIYAANMMTWNSENTKRIGNRKYEWLRKLHKNAASLDQYERWNDAAFREKTIAGMKRYHALPETKIKLSYIQKKAQGSAEARSLKSVNMKKYYEDPANRRNQSDIQCDPTVNARRAATHCMNFADPEFKQNHLNAVQDESNRAHLSKVITEKWEDPDYRQKQAESRRSSKYIEAASQRNIEIQNRPEVKQKKSDKQKELFSDPDYVEYHRESVKFACNSKEEIQRRKSSMDSLWEMRNKFIELTGYTGNKKKITKEMIESYIVKVDIK